jgi:hypothetical protein
VTAGAGSPLGARTGHDLYAIAERLPLWIVRRTPRASQPSHIPGTQNAHLDEEQLSYANFIITVGELNRWPQRAQVIAVATALQESGLRNLPPGRNNALVGLFQQSRFTCEVDPWRYRITGPRSGDLSHRSSPQHSREHPRNTGRTRLAEGRPANGAKGERSGLLSAA